MNRQHGGILIPIILILVAVGFVGGAVYRHEHHQSVVQAARERALKEAESYKVAANEACGMAITNAVHEATGTEFVFTSTCLPSGWVKKGQ